MIFVVISTDDLTSLAEHGAARGLPAPHRDGVRAAPPGHAALQPSGDSRGRPTGALARAHAGDSGKLEKMQEG